MNIKKYLMIIFCVIGICLAALSGVILASKMMVPIGGEQGVIDNLPKPPPKARANFLIMGLDKDLLHADTLMMFSVDFVNKNVSILSIPRDTRIQYNGQYDKINHTYIYDGKEENVIKAVRQITGLPIHYYAVVDFKGFRNIIDTLGGVEFDVPDVNKGGMYYEDPYQGLSIKLKAGPQVLNGKDAEGLVRFRSGYANADLGRIDMQQKFVKELIKQKLQLKYINKAGEIYKEIISSVRTNYTVMDALSHLSFIKDMDAENIQSFSLPGHGQEASTRYGYLDCFIYNVKETDAIIKEYFSNLPVEKADESTETTGNTE